MPLLNNPVLSIIQDPVRLKVLSCFAPQPWRQETEFDLMSDMLAEICDVPIALVTIVDEEHQFFFGKTGTPETGNTTDLSFCAYTVSDAQSGPFVVLDLSTDPRFSDHPLVKGDPKLRFYAGVAVLVDGQPIGTVCVIDVKPHKDFDDRKRQHCNDSQPWPVRFSNSRKAPDEAKYRKPPDYARSGVTEWR